MSSDALLMIFVKNPELGRVKTRLAKTIGNDMALVIYHHLLTHTCTVAQQVSADKAIHYSAFIDDLDEFKREEFQKYMQVGEDLGVRMKNAFKRGFDDGYQNVVIIGSDCYELTPTHIEEAIEALKTNEFVLGPAKDGGYYLLGMSCFNEELFLGKNWSTENVMLDTLIDIQRMEASYHLLPTLSDVDQEEDLGSLRELINDKNKME